MREDDFVDFGEEPIGCIKEDFASKVNAVMEMIRARKDTSIPTYINCPDCSYTQFKDNKDYAGFEVVDGRLLLYLKGSVECTAITGTISYE